MEHQKILNLLNKPNDFEFVTRKMPFEMPLNNCKVELKLNWTKHFVLSTAGNDNANDNDSANNITFTIKYTELSIPVVAFSARDNKNLSKLLCKGFERSVYWNDYNTKSENKNTRNE